MDRKKPDPELLLARILEDRAKVEGSCNKLAKRISEANSYQGRDGSITRRGSARKDKTGKRGKKDNKEKKDRKNRAGNTGDIVDRRKLMKIIQTHGRRDPGVVFTLRELIAINTYLELHGLGLTQVPLFIRPQIIDALAKSTEVYFGIACRARRYRLDYSHWDIESMATIQDHVGRLATNIQFHITHVPRHKDVEDAAWRMRTPEIEELLGDDGPSLVCVGSPRVNHITEVVLARMFDVEPFDDPTSHNDIIPFQFAWNKERDHNFKSCVATDMASTGRKSPANGEDDGVSGFRLDGQWRFARPVSDDQNGLRQTYGVVVAQRRRSGQLWVVIAGLTGAATYAATQAAHSIPDLVPHSPRMNDHSAVQWTVIEAGLELDTNLPGMQIPRIKRFETIGDHHKWTGGRS